MRKLLIVLHHGFDLWNAPPWFADRLRNNFPQLEVVHLADYTELEDEICEAEIVLAWSLRPHQVAVAHKLRWIHSPAAAVHQLLFPELINSDVVITNARDVHGPVVAEHVMALILALAKKIPQSVRFQQRRFWGQQRVWSEPPRPREITGATVGLVGLGSIGREVAKRASALGMRVIAAREHPEKGADNVAALFSPAQLDDLLLQADFVVLAAPLTARTSNLLDSSRLAKMKADSYLINVSRGPLVDESALAETLREKRIAGAALDVFSKEPLPQESALWDLDNLLITSHTAALTAKLWDRHYALFSQNLRRYLNHEALLGIVDKLKGY
jgi:phosphoglycerate dehydrogenase-like enzyme